MTIAQKELEHIARLACLDLETDQNSQLSDDINAIMNFVEELRATNTNNVAPLFHPLALHQRLRDDAITEDNCLAQLAEIAPLFEDDLYLVPKVIESGK